MLYLITPLTTPLGSGITQSVHTIWKTLLISNQHFYWIVRSGTSLVKWLMVYGQAMAYQLKLTMMIIFNALEISYGETNSILIFFCFKIYDLHWNTAVSRKVVQLKSIKAYTTIPKGMMGCGCSLLHRQFTSFQRVGRRCYEYLFACVKRNKMDSELLTCLLKFIEYFADYLSALSRTLLRFFWTTFVETAVF